MMKRILFFVSFVMLLFSCQNNGNEKAMINLQKENLLLRDSLKNVREELEGYKNSPDKLCANISVLFDNEDLDKLEEIKSKLAKYHPESKEFKDVESMCSKIMEKRIRKIEEDQKKQKQEIEEEQKKRMQAVSKLKKKYDDVSGTTWYYNPYFIHYTNSNLTSIYIGQKEGEVWLRMVMSYYGDDWIFFKNAYLSYDGKTKDISFDEYRDKKTENDSSVWEWIDVSVDRDILSFLKQMVNGKSVKMRLSGKYTKTRNLTTKEINGIKDVLLGYDVLLNEK